MATSKKDWTTGRVQVYTGNGKGKTTAALGLAFRAAGAGLRTYVGQFMKGMKYSELDSAALTAGAVTIEQYGHPEFCQVGKTSPEDKRLAAEGLSRIRAAIASGLYDIVVMDEVCTTLFFKLLTVEEILDVIQSKPDGLELVLTGRYAPESLIAAADLVTEMKEIKHYYEKGVPSRVGIEN